MALVAYAVFRSRSRDQNLMFGRDLLVLCGSFFGYRIWLAMFRRYAATGDGRLASGGSAALHPRQFTGRRYAAAV
jgi:hypothetical protein